MHIMLDLETLGTRQSSVVTQIGFAQFELEADGVIASGCLHLDPAEQIRLGRTVTWATIKWWLTQSEEARQAMVVEDRMSLTVAKEVFALMPWDKIDGVWGHGATFDIAILDNLYGQFNENPPWNFRVPRDTRTLFSMRPDMKMENVGVAHKAEDDAIAQALHVQKVWKAVNGG